MPIITWRIRAVSCQNNVCTLFDFFFLKDCGLGDFSFEGFFPSALEHERTIVFSVHANCCRGGSCKHLLLNTVLLLSTDSILLISLSALTFFLFWVLTHTPVSILRFWLENSCPDLLIQMSLHNDGLQLQITRHRSDLIVFLFTHSKYCFGVDQTLVFASCTNFPESCHWKPHSLMANLDPIWNQKPECRRHVKWYWINQSNQEQLHEHQLP